jgi:hypothetical protein
MIRIGRVFLFMMLVVLFQNTLAQEMLNPKEDFLYDGKYFGAYSPYVTLGVGYGVNYKQQEGEQNIAADFHLYHKNVGYNIGYFSSSSRFLEGTGGLRHFESRQKLHDLHLGVGYRYERLRHIFAIYGGPSYVGGRVPTDTISSLSTFIIRRGPGLYLQAHYAYKVAYDVGLGVTFYAAYSKHYKIIGVQAHIFLSSAFKAYYKRK